MPEPQKFHSQAHKDVLNARRGRASKERKSKCWAESCRVSISFQRESVVRRHISFLQKAASENSFELESVPMSQRVIRESTGLKEATGLTVGLVMFQAWYMYSFQFV